MVADPSENGSVAVVGRCVNCDHDDHYGERCDGTADGDWCACSWPDPSNFTDLQPKLTIRHVTWRSAKAFVGQEHRHHPRGVA